MGSRFKPKAAYNGRLCSLRPIISSTLESPKPHNNSTSGFLIRPSKGHPTATPIGISQTPSDNKKGRLGEGGLCCCRLSLIYSRSERFQLIRSPSVVLLEEEEELLWSLSRSL